MASPQIRISEIVFDAPDLEVEATLDLTVADIAAAHAHAVSIGATVLAPGDGPDLSKERGFVVYADPAGHPFCLCW